MAENDNLTGTSLTDYNVDLTYVPQIHNDVPVRAINALETMSPGKEQEVLDYFGAEEIRDIIHHLPLKAFLALDEDQRAKTIHSCTESIESQTKRELNRSPIQHVVHKIKSSMWRWGLNDAPWNEIVDAYNGIRNFDMGIAGFETRLDTTSSYCEKGWSVHAKIYLDGVFGLLVHWKGRHVLTIGFSIVSDRRLLLQQIQSTSPTGNRWRFKLPGNLTEFVVDRLAASFPQYTIHIADGADYAQRSLKEYQHGLSRYSSDMIENAAKTNPAEAERLKKEMSYYEDKIAHLKNDMTRIARIYADAGRYTRGNEFTANGMRHYALAA